jgi:hypothetical protein
VGEDKKYHNSSINIYFVDDEESIDEEDFENLGFWSFWDKWALAYRIFVYTISMVKGCTSAKHIFTSFCAVYTRILTPAPMGYITLYARTYAARRIKYYGIILVNITW